MLSSRQKLIAGFGGIIAIAVSLMGAQMLLNQRVTRLLALQRNGHEELAAANTLLGAVGEARQAAGALGDYLDDPLPARYPARLQGLLNAVDQKAARLVQAVDDVAFPSDVRAAADDGEREARTRGQFAQLRATTEAQQALVREIRSAFRRDDVATARRVLTTELFPFYAVTVTPRIRTLLAHAATTVEESGSLAAAEMRRVTQIQILGTASAVVLSLWIAWTTSRSIRRQEHRLERAKVAALASSQAKSDFLANMSHEIRTPMNGVIGTADLLADTQLTALQREYLGILSSSAHSLLGVLNDILDLSKIEAGKIAIERVDFNLHDALVAALRVHALAAREKGVELLLELAPETIERVAGDPLRLRQILLNLIGNAVKFTDQGEIRVSAATELAGGGAIRLSVAVADTGIGIPEARRKEIFVPFEQADMSTTRRFGGTGLGLAIGRQLVELMGGSLHVDSREGDGGTFSFTIMLVPPSVAAPSVSAAMATASLQGVSVLIVDDNATNRRLLLDMTTKWDMRSVAVDGGEAALALLEQRVTDGDPVSLVLLDLNMPGLDGVTTAERMRANPLLRHATVLMLTSAERPRDLERIRNLNLASHLIKPITMKELRESLVRVLARDSHEGRVAAPSVPAIAYVRRDQLQVLLAEDNVVNTRIATAMLSAMGHTVHAVANGRQAVEAVQHRQFDVIVLDMEMPEMDGFEATRAIRALEEGAGVRTAIIALTARAMTGDREECLAAGMDGYVTKPIATAALIRVFDDVLGPRVSQARAS